jgi:mannose-P-dolichol utilization defect protein 1
MYLYYTGKYPAAAMFLPIYATVAYALSSGFTPMIVLTNLQVTTIPVMATSKVFQIMANYKNGHTGQLSAITTFMNFAGTLARIFTTIQEVDDALILFSFVCSTLLNGILAFQVIMYWKVKVSDEKKEK